MKRKILLIVIALLGIGVITSIFFLGGIVKSQKAVLSIETNPVSQVVVDGVTMGKTPFEQEFDAKEVTIKLIPESFGDPLVAYETRVTLTKGVKTVIRRDLGKTQGQSGGEIVSFEHTGRDLANISVVTTPDGAQVSLDGKVVDNAPVKIPSVNPGEHQLTVKAEGYGDRTVAIVPVKGYDLTAIVDLALNGDQQAASGSAQPADAKANLPQVRIGDTPTGFLRVRSGPSVDSKEISQIKPGEKYVLLDDSNKDWYKIELGNDISGWVSAKYATKVDSQG